MSAMLDYSRSREQLDELHAAHRRTRDKREADRIKAVVALATVGQRRKSLSCYRLIPT
ncbi:MAG: Mobile element protein, partial [Olavius algarvensis Gamma 1 endosymbiont]